MPLPAFHTQPDPAAADAWFASDAGRALLDSEAELVAEAARSRLGPAVLWFGPSMATPPRDPESGLPLCLHGGAAGFHGDLRCRLPLPLAGLFRPQIQGFLISSFRLDPAQLVAGLTLPVLIMQGERDLQVKVEDARRLAAAQPRARLACFHTSWRPPKLAWCSMRSMANLLLIK